MTNKDLMKLSRKQLLELLLRETERVDYLEDRINKAQKKLDERRTVEAEAATVAEAAIQLSGIIEAAQTAVNQYVESVKALSQRLDETGREADSIAQRRAQAILIDAQRQCAERESEIENKVLQSTVKLRQMYKNKRMLDELSQEHKLK